LQQNTIVWVVLLTSNEQIVRGFVKLELAVKTALPLITPITLLAVNFDPTL